MGACSPCHNMCLHGCLRINVLPHIHPHTCRRDLDAACAAAESGGPDELAALDQSLAAVAKLPRIPVADRGRVQAARELGEKLATVRVVKALQRAVSQFQGTWEQRLQRKAVGAHVVILPPTDGNGAVDDLSLIHI